MRIEHAYANLKAGSRRWGTVGGGEGEGTQTCNVCEVTYVLVPSRMNLSVIIHELHIVSLSQL